VLEALEAYLEAPEILSFKGKRQAGNSDINRLTEELRKRDSLWLVFDDLSYIIDEKQYFTDSGLGLLFKALRDNTHNAKIILTSRVMPLLDNGEYLIDELEDENKQQIRGLKQNFAISYLKENGFESVELKILEFLLTNIGGHPFSLKLLAGLAKKHTAENILKDLSPFRKHQKDRIKSARFLFDKLVGGEKELLERIAVYRQPEPLEAIKIMFTDSVPVDSVDTLLDKSLLETDRNGNYWLHPLVQEFSYEDLKNKKEAHMLAVKYYLTLQLPEKPTRKEDVQSLIEAHYHACNAERIDLAAKILYHSNLCGQLEFWGNFKIIVELCTPLLPHISLERRIIPLECHGYFLGILGIACFKLGFAEEAIILIEGALKITRIRGNKKGEANQLGNLGLAYQRLGNHKKSIEYYKQVIEIAKEVGDQRGEGNSYGNLGNAYLELGETEQAIINYKNAVQVLGDIGDKRGESSYLSDLGIVYSQIGKMDEGIYFLKQSLDIFKNIGDKIGEKNQHMNMGIAYKNAGMLEKSIECYREALKISTELEDKSGEGDLLGNIGNLFLVFGQPEEAVIYYKQSLIIDRETRNKKGEGINLVSLGMSYIALGQLEIAIEFLKQSLAIGKAIEDPRIISFCEKKLKELEGSD
jgi:tetratricopeptide (TPR) repeat protein